jgi:hypothetical protein
MSRSDLKELGEYLDEGQAGLVVGVTEMEVDIKQSMNHAEKVETRELQAACVRCWCSAWSSLWPAFLPAAQPPQYGLGLG